MNELPTPIDLEWERRAQEASTCALECVRAAAEKWRAALIPTVGILTMVAAFAAPNLAVALSRGTYTLLIKVFIALGLALLVVATTLVMRVAFGVPRKLESGFHAYRLWYQKEVKQCSTYLNIARWMILAGLGLLTLATVSGFMAPAQSSDSMTVRAELSTGDYYCGRLTNDPNGTTLTVTAKDGTIHSFASSNILALQVVNVTC